MEAIIAHIQSNWVIWLFCGLSALLGYILKQVKRELREERENRRAIGSGVEALLRESIVANYNKYTERDYCPIYAKESVKRMYVAYHALGGNDVATELYEHLLEMPTEKKEELS